MKVKKFGFELEIAYWGIRKFKELAVDLNNIEVLTDGSVMTYRQEELFFKEDGIEIRFHQPVTKVSEFKSQTKQISDFVIKNNLKFLNGSDTIYSFKKKHISRAINDTSCGLHIHYDIPKGVKNLNKKLTKLYKLTLDREEHLIELAGRVNQEYAVPIKLDLEYSMQELEEYIEDSIECPSKYRGLNICNLSNSSSKHTVEFRYAHAAIITDHNRTMEYFHLCKDIVEEAFSYSS